MRFSAFGFGALVVVVSAIPGVFSNVLLLDVFNYTSPQIGSRVEFHCHGPAIRQLGDTFFVNGGKLIWLSGNSTIAHSSIIQRDQYINDTSKYSISVFTLSSHGIINTYFALQIKSVSVDDSGPYSCALSSDQKSFNVRSPQKTLSVQFPPHKLYPQCNVDSIPHDSKSITLRCRSQTAFPSVHLYWRSSRGILSNVALTSPDGFSVTDVVIPIPSTETEYTCISNYTGDFEQFTKRCKLYSPVVSLKNPEEVVEGGEAEFTCSVSAEPNSEDGVMWTANPPLIARNKTTSHNSNSVSTLTISNVTAQDNGTKIVCHSKNLLGENHEQKLLIVKTFGSSTGIYVPPVRVGIEPKIAEVPAGEMATFECVVSTYKSSYKYKWYYKEEEIHSKSESNKFLIEQTQFQRLHVRNVDASDNNSTVSCVVMADGHEETARANLIVIPTPRVEGSSQTDTSDALSEYWKVIVLISGGLVCFILTMMCIWLAVKTKVKLSRSKNQSRVHNVDEHVGYVTSVGSGMHTFNNEPRTVPPATNAPSNTSTFSPASPKVVNQERLVVNLPPVPSIPPEGIAQHQEELRAANKKLGEEEYEDMETVRLNFYHTREEHNEYQHVINGLWRSNSRQDSTSVTFQTGKGTPEPIY